MNQSRTSLIEREGAGGLGPPAAYEHRSPILGLEAEALLTIQLLVRSRAMRLTVVLVVVLVAWQATSAAAMSPAATVRLMLLVGGSLGAVAGAQALADGPPTHALRRAGASIVLHTVGRLLGVSAVLLPVLMTTAGLLGDGDARMFARLAGAGAVLGLAVAGLAAALAARIGSSSAGVVGLLAVWLGFLNPSAVSVLVAGWPGGNAVLWMWHALPLPWRAEQLSAHPAHPVVLGAWVVVGFFLGVLGAAVGRGAEYR